jgi:hypothetical protein
MQDRRGFLRTIIGAAVGVATGGLGKVAAALTSKKVIDGCWGKSILDAGYLFAPYIPLQFVKLEAPLIRAPWPVLSLRAIVESNSLKNL